MKISLLEGHSLPGALTSLSHVVMVMMREGSVFDIAFEDGALLRSTVSLHVLGQDAKRPDWERLRRLPTVCNLCELDVALSVAVVSMPMVGKRLMSQAA